MIVHDFREKLERSREGMTAQALIQSWLTGCVNVEAASLQDDRNGIDYWATLRGGAMVGIDHKLREPGASRFWGYGFPELALEIWSVKPDETLRTEGTVGWTLSETKNTDYILYTFAPTDSPRAYLIPFQLLRIAFRQYFHEWCEQYKAKNQSSGEWMSQAVFVPAPIVIEAVGEHMDRIT